MVLKCRGWSWKWRAEQLDPPVIREETAIRHCGPLWNGSIGIDKPWYKHIKRIKVLYHYIIFSTYFLVECKWTRNAFKYKKTDVSHIHILCGPARYEAFQNQQITESFEPRWLGFIFQEKSGVNWMENVPQAWQGILTNFMNFFVSWWVFGISVFEKENISSQAAKCTYLEPAPFVTLPP